MIGIRNTCICLCAAMAGIGFSQPPSGGYGPGGSVHTFSMGPGQGFASPYRTVTPSGSVRMHSSSSDMDHSSHKSYAPPGSKSGRSSSSESDQSDQPDSNQSSTKRSFLRNPLKIIKNHIPGHSVSGDSGMSQDSAKGESRGNKTTRETKKTNHTGQNTDGPDGPGSKVTEGVRAPGKPVIKHGGDVISGVYENRRIIPHPPIPGALTPPPPGGLRVRLDPSYNLPMASPAEMGLLFRKSSKRIQEEMQAGASVEEELGQVRTHATQLKGRLRGLPLESRLKLGAISAMYEDGASLIEEGQSSGEQSKVQMGLDKIENANQLLDELEGE